MKVERELKVEGEKTKKLSKGKTESRNRKYKKKLR